MAKPNPSVAGAEHVPSIDTYLYRIHRKSYATIIFNNPRLILFDVVQSMTKTLK